VEVGDYLPRGDRVGPPARKLFVTDGTRYLPSGTDPLDFDAGMDFEDDPHGWLFGSFTDAGAWWAGSVAYGVKSGTPNWDGNAVNPSPACASQGRNLALTYRHGNQRGTLSGSARDNNGTINALFFDGHVQRLSDRRSRDVDLWYPTGTKVTNPAEGMTTVPMGFVIP
jgi:prepilin-type processing-associated H-X9-DG protein